MLIERAFPLSLGIEAPLVTVFLPVLWLIYLLDFWNILVDGLIYWFPSIFGCLASSGWSQGYFLTRVAKSLNTLRKVDPLTFKLKHLCSPTSDSQPPPIIAKPGPLMPINCVLAVPFLLIISSISPCEPISGYSRDIREGIGLISCHLNPWFYSLKKWCQVEEVA